MPPVLDFCGTKEVILVYTDLSGVREIKGPTKKINLSFCKNLPPVLDFNRTKEVMLSNTDLSGAREIKRSDKNTWPEHLQKSYDLWRARMLVKNRSQEIAQQNVPGRDTSNER